MPLTSDAISQQETERKAQELLYEFYQEFFTGGAVTIAGVAQTLPVCDYFFAVQSIPAPSLKPQIHTVFTDWRQRENWQGDGKRVEVDLQATITVRAANPGAGASNPDHTARRVADAVRQLIESEKILLGQKGIRHAQVRRGPVPIPFPGMSCRLMVASLQLAYIAVA